MSLGSPRDLNDPNRRMRTRTSGGVAGADRVIPGRPYADLCAFHDDRTFLSELRQAIEEVLFDLRLRLHERKSRLRRVKEGITFLGFVVLPDRVRLGPKAVRRARRKIRLLRWKYASGSIAWGAVEASLSSWCAHGANGTTLGLRTEVLRRSSFVRRS